MSYGADTGTLFHGAAAYVDKILKGADPAELPITQATKFILTVNLKTARALGITFPSSILLRADRVIEPEELKFIDQLASQLALPETMSQQIISVMDILHRDALAMADE